MAVTKIYSTLVFVVAALAAIVLGFSPKFGALILTIPGPVLGGLAIVVFGLITATAAASGCRMPSIFRARATSSPSPSRSPSAPAIWIEDRRLHPGRHRHGDLRRDPALSVAA
jgi:hypothetical protein